MTKNKTYNIFVSHHHKDQNELDKLKELLKSRGNDVRDSSIDASNPNDAKNPDYIKTIIRSRIEWAGQILVLIGPETHERKWVDWEIENAHRQDKRIIGIYVRGGKESEIPSNFEKYGDSLVGWDFEKIMGAINKDHNDWLTPDGDPRGDKWNTERSTC